MNGDEEQRLRGLVAETLRVAPEQLERDTPFSELGADSLDLVELGMAVEEAFALEIDAKDYGSFRTLGDALDYVQQKRAGVLAPSLAAEVARAAQVSAPSAQPERRPVARANAERMRVVISGVGAVSPLGLDVSTTWSRLLAGESALGVAHALPESLPVRLGATIPDFTASPFASEREAHRQGRFTQLALCAADQAYRDARLEQAGLWPEQLAVVVGVGVGGLEVFETGMRTLLSEGWRRVSPFSVLGLSPNMAAASVARRFGARGPSFTVSSACASAGHALGEALSLLRSGRVEAVLAGGAEACVTEVALVSFARMAALSTRSATPASALRPFDRTRDGFVLGEGAAMFVLESYQRARARGAQIYAELAGFGASSDSFHDTQPDPEGRGAQSAMQEALADAQLEPAQVGYVNAHGTGTPLGDRIETLAIRRTFGAHADRLLVSSTKGATGHLLGASGALEALFCALALRDQKVPPTLHLTEPDPECDLDYVPLRTRELAFTAALSNSFGFGGQNACLALTKV